MQYLSKLVAGVGSTLAFLVEYRISVGVFAALIALVLVALRWHWLWWVYLGIVLATLVILAWLVWSLRDFRM